MFAKLALAAALAFCCTAPARAAPATWSETKCANYRAAWQHTLSRRGTTGLGAEFLARHEAFIASGCHGPGDACPRSREELEIANIMVVLAMNAGAASTFLPFHCRS